MASFQQNEYCSQCQKTVFTDNGLCKDCGSKVKKGTWTVVFRVNDYKGKPIQKRLSGFSKKIFAEIGYRKFLEEYVALNTQSVEDQMTFNQLYFKYIDYKKARLKSTSIYDMKNVITKRILPTFGAMPVLKINKLDVLHWQEQLDISNFSYKYKSNLRGYMSSIFKYGVMYCDLSINPVQQVEPFRNTEKKKQMQIWTKEDFITFISSVDDELYKCFFYTLYFSGCRKGELFALTWNDINFDSGILDINKSLSRKDSKMAYIITTTKNTSSERKLLLPPSCIAMLKQLKGNSKSGGSFVFGNKVPLAENTVTRKLKHYCELSGTKLIRLHDFRHSHASLLISNGESILMVAKRLGHSNIEQTLNTYAHIMPNQESSMISKIDINF